MTEYLSLRRRPEVFNLRLRLRPPHFLAENFHLSRRCRKMIFLPLIDHKSFACLLFWVYKVVTTEIHKSKTLLFSKGKLAVTIFGFGLMSKIRLRSYSAPEPISTLWWMSLCLKRPTTGKNQFSKGPFKNYVDKMRLVGVQSNVHVCPRKVGR